MKYIAIASSLLLLAACQSPTTATSPSPSTSASASASAPSDSGCGAQNRQQLVGTAAKALDESSLPPGTRVLYPNTLATTDYRPDRLNILVGESGKIETVRCG